jgi:hypothetical protein
MINDQSDSSRITPTKRSKNHYYITSTSNLREPFASINHARAGGLPSDHPAAALGGAPGQPERVSPHYDILLAGEIT